MAVIKLVEYESNKNLGDVSISRVPFMGEFLFVDGNELKVMRVNHLCNPKTLDAIVESRNLRSEK